MSKKTTVSQNAASKLMGTVSSSRSSGFQITRMNESIRRSSAYASGMLGKEYSPLRIDPDERRRVTESHSDFYSSMETELKKLKKR